MAEVPQSRTEAILRATIDGQEYNNLPESRIEALLLELKEVIESGGGGGGTGDYNNLVNQPQINGHTLVGNMTPAELQIEEPLTEQQMNNLLSLI